VLLVGVLSEYEYLILLCQSGLGGRVEVRTTNNRGRRVIYAATMVAAESGFGSAPMSEGAVIVRRHFGSTHAAATFTVHTHSKLCSLLTAPCSPLSIHCSLFTALFSLLSFHCSLFTALFSLLSFHCSLFTALFSLLSAHCSPLTALRSLLSAHCSAHCSLFTVHCALLTLLRLAFSLRSFIYFFFFLFLLLFLASTSHEQTSPS
jgi:hypothetical protein